MNSFSVEEIAYHLNMLIEDGYVKGTKTVDRRIPWFSQLTSSGHYFLDNIRENTVWGRVKERLAELPGASLSVVAQLGLQEIKKKLGLS
jgi:hypothetical protein